MRIGIEIETHVPTNVNIGGWSTGRTNRGLEGWTAGTDSTIHPPRGRRGCEFKTTGDWQLTEENLEKIADSVRFMKEHLDAKVNASCGLHIHIEWNSNDLKKLRRLIHTVAHYEEAFYGVTGTVKRKTGTWSRSIKDTHRDLNYGRPRRSPYSDSPFRDVSRVGIRRYHVLNLQPLFGNTRHAVEFRVFAGTLNVSKIIGAICMCAGVVESCLGRTSTPQWNAPTQDRESYRADGEAELTLTRLFYRLGWWPKKNRKGVDELIKASERGLNVPTLKAIKKTMIEMCKKYDIASRRRAQRIARSA